MHGGNHLCNTCAQNLPLHSDGSEEKMIITLDGSKDEDDVNTSIQDSSFVGVMPPRKSEKYITAQYTSESDEDYDDAKHHIAARAKEKEINRSSLSKEDEILQPPAPQYTKKTKPSKQKSKSPSGKKDHELSFRCKACSHRFDRIADLNAHIYDHIQATYYRFTDEAGNTKFGSIKVDCNRCNKRFDSIYHVFSDHDENCDLDMTIQSQKGVLQESVQIPIYDGMLVLSQHEMRGTRRLVYECSDENGRHVEKTLERSFVKDARLNRVSTHGRIYGTSTSWEESSMEKAARKSATLERNSSHYFGTSTPWEESYMEKAAGKSASISRSKFQYSGTSIGSPTSYKTAQSTLSSYATAPRSFPFLGGFTPGTSGPRRGLPTRLKPNAAKGSTESGEVFSSEWLNFLRSRGIILSPDEELDWSGKGQHVEYTPQEEARIPLTLEKVIGYSATALVESVMCRRIRLARKRIKCHRRLTKKVLIGEVEHLQRLRHSHIVRVVGTYTIGQELSILLYPVTEWNLEEFMDNTVRLTPLRCRFVEVIYPNLPDKNLAWKPSNRWKLNRL